MNRRKFIQLTIPGILPTAGCLRSSRDRSPTTVSGNQSKTTTSRTESTQTAEPKKETTPRENSENKQGISASVIQPADEAGVEIEVKFLHQFTERKPARLRIRLTNSGEDSRQFRFGSSPPLSSYKGEDINSNNKLVIVPDNRSRISIGDRNDDGKLRLIPAKPKNSCWRIEDRIIGQDILVPRTLDSGESLIETYTVLAGSENTTCIPASKFRFSGSFEVENEQFGWQFVVSVDEGV